MFETEVIPSFQWFLNSDETGNEDFLSEHAGMPEELPFFRVGGFFETLGALVKRKVVPLALVEDMFHGVIHRGWLKAQKPIEEYRNRTKHRGFMEWFEYIYRKTEECRKSTH